MTKLTQATAVALSTAAHMVRDDWDHPGILHALRIEADKGTSAEDVFIALANLAANPQARTPALLNRPGSWWTKPTGSIARRGDNDMPCPDHPEHTHPCPECHDQRVTSAGHASDGAAMVRAAIAAAPKYVTPAVRQAQAQESQ